MKTERNPLFSYHRLSDKEIKNLEILDLIRKRGVISRTDISKIAGLNIVSVSHYIKDYIDKKLVFEKGLGASSGGRKPELVELAIKDNYVIGLEIGRTEIRIVLTDLKVKVVEKLKIPRLKTSDKDVAVKSIGLIEEIMKKSHIPVNNIRAIGIGTTDSDFISIGKAVEKKFGIDSFVGCHASCAAFGEKCLNANADVHKLLYIYSDLGYGVFLHGNTCLGAISEIEGYENEDQFAENVKYLKPWNEALGMVRYAKREVEKGIGTKIVNLANAKMDNITEEIVISAARQNDEIALAIVETIGINLGLRIAYLINIFNPEVVVIGGGAEKSGDLVLGTIKKMVNRLAFYKQARTVKIMPSILGEDAVSLGAASLAIREIFLRI